MKTYLLQVTFDPAYFVIDSVSVILDLDTAIDHFNQYFQSEFYHSRVLRISLDEYEDGLHCDRLGFYQKCFPAG